MRVLLIEEVMEAVGVGEGAVAKAVEVEAVEFEAIEGVGVVESVSKIN
jgi:hypothetical protein